MEDSDENDALQPTVSRSYSWYMLGILFLCYVVNAIDRQIFSILSQDMKRHFQIDDAELGFLYGTAFAVCYLLFGLAFARLADVWNRTRILSFGLTVWSLMTVFCGLAANYAQLALARTGVGFGEATASPTAYSLIGDLFPKEQRAMALSIYNAGVFLGLGAALPLGGWIVRAWEARYGGGDAPLGLEGWQAAFMLVGIPGILLAAWMLTLREPPRHGAIDPQDERIRSGGIIRHFVAETAAVLPPITLWTASRLPGGLRVNLLILASIAVVAALLIVLTGDTAQWAVLGYGAYAVGTWLQRLQASDPRAFEGILRNNTIVRLLVVSFCISALSTSVLFWMSPYAMRTFEMESGAVGITLGIPSAVASALGSIVGGYFSDFAIRRTPFGRIYVVMASVVLSPLFAVVAFMSADFGAFVLGLMGALFAIALHFGSLGAAIQDLLPPRMRATGAATMYIALSLGIAMGPYISGRVSVLTGSLMLGVLTVVALMPLALAFLFLARLSLRREARSQ